MRNRVTLFFFCMAFGCTNAFAAKLTLEQIQERLGDLNTQVSEFKVKNCSTATYPLDTLCEDVSEKIGNALSGFSADIDSHTNVRVSHFKGDQRLQSKYYLKKLDVSYKVDETGTGVETIPDGMEFGDIFFPLVSKLDITGYVTGDGYVQYRYTITSVPKKIVHKENLDLDVDGDFSMTVYTALALNPHISQDGNGDYHIYMQPKFRLIPSSFEHDLEFDVSGSGLVTILLEMSDTIIHLGNIALDNVFNKENVSESEKAFVNSLAGSFVNSLILIDDVGDDALFEMLSDIVHTTYSSEIDEMAERALIQQEINIQKQLDEKLQSLGLSQDNALKITMPKSYVHGKAYAKILPAIHSLL